MSTSILSVGIDIGTTTTQVIFSRLAMANMSSYFSAPRVEIVDKRVIYKSEIRLTPLLSETRLDVDGVKALVENEFRQAGFKLGGVDTGAVIITGEAARKENAGEVLERMSGLAGDFVVSTAGPDLESVIAGKGSGACKYSLDCGCVVANLDIGGGTTNIAVFDAGETVTVGCLDIGGRLVRIHPSGRVDRVSPKAALAAREAGIDLRPGMRADVGDLAKVAGVMNRCLEEALGLAPASALLARLETAGGSRLGLDRPLDAIGFSGGVADCVYRPAKDPFAYGDLGVLLGRAIAAGRLPGAARLVEPAETIRATVIGAGSHSVAVSGSTITFTGGALPRKNLPVLALARPAEDALFRGECGPLAEKAEWFLRQTDGGQLILGLAGRENPSYAELARAAGCIAETLDRLLPPKAPVFVSVERDIAKALGQCLDDRLSARRPVVCIDGVQLREGDFLDLGKPLMGGMVIPVVVKTLILG